MGPAPTSPVNFDPELTTFVGRREELAQARRLLAESRLVTLAGLGGVGKTRLVLRTATQVQRTFRDGVRVVELAALREPGLLAQTMIDSLKLTEVSSRDSIETVEDYLRPRHMLLVLDNCEQLLEETALLVVRLLQSAPQLRILATSRQSLGVPGEAVLKVSPLPVPSPDEPVPAGAGQRYAALVLFADRAATAVPGFTVTPTNLPNVARICQQLEGIPLAIELAAVRLKVLSVADLADRLDHRLQLLTEGSRTTPTRHHTLRATIDWSFDLCSPSEQLLWTRVSVFAGSFDLDAATAVCGGDGLDQDSILNGLSGLMAQSIVAREERDGHVRFRLLETIREYGQDKLRDSQAAPLLRQRHLQWYVALMDRAVAEWFGPAEENLLTRLRLEQPNLRVAFEYCLTEPGQSSAGLHLAGRAWFLWALYLAEGRHWLDRLLKIESEPSPERAWALATRAFVAALQGDQAAAATSLDECFAAAKDSPDETTEAYALHIRGLAAYLIGDAEHGVQKMTEALARYTTLRAPAGLLTNLQIAMGLAYIFLEQPDQALEHFESSRRLSESHGEHWLLSYAVYGRAFVDFTQGHLEPAERGVREALLLYQAFPDTLGRAMALDLYAWVSADRHEPERTAFLLGCAHRLWSSFGMQLFGSRSWQVHRERCETTARREAGNRLFDAVFDRGAGLPPDEMLAHALDRPRPSAPKSPPKDDILTKRETEVAGLVSEGLSNREIAERLVISPRTVATHVENILVKLGFTSRSRIAAWMTGRQT
ncbi:LuxR C-terminal-related transcriptional regulator [Rhodococcus koreensis]|uniref:LuxR C-terminal-related transcriptional regulator n=1 Tax=Rhodococcus koreensis TaxID=99653 RepID=UPI00367334CD